MIIGLTGGIASGKSTVVEMIKEENGKTQLCLNNHSPTDKNKTQSDYVF